MPVIRWRRTRPDRRRLIGRPVHGSLTAHSTCPNPKTRRASFARWSSSWPILRRNGPRSTRPPDDQRENDYAKGELKAMIERKRRNDFVRKREFDMLRKVRREGLTGEQLAALGGSSRLDDSEPRNPDSGARQDSGVKAKIDEIEQQMVGDNYAATTRRGPEFYNAPTAPAPLEARPPAATAPRPAPVEPQGGRVDDFVAPEAPPQRASAPAPGRTAPATPLPRSAAVRHRSARARPRRRDASERRIALARRPRRGARGALEGLRRRQQRGRPTIPNSTKPSSPSRMPISSSASRPC